MLVTCNHARLHINLISDNYKQSYRSNFNVKIICHVLLLMTLNPIFGLDGELYILQYWLENGDIIELRHLFMTLL